jgi:glycosyltransferase involved in cell wall biosynthesis
MRVLVFHQHFTTRSGATITRVYQFVRRLVDRGHEVTVVTATAAMATTGLEGPFVHGRREGLVEGIRVIELTGRYSNYQSVWQRTFEFASFTARSLRYALTEDYDLVYCKTVPLTLALPGIAGRLLRRKPFVFDVGDLWPAIPRAMGVRNPLLLGAMSALEWAGYHAADLNIAVAPGIVGGIRDRGIPDERIVFIPNGAELDLFTPCPADAPRPVIPGVGPDELVAVYAGKHGRTNGLEVVVETARHLAALGRHDIRVVLIGDGACKPALVEQAKGLSNLLFLEPMPKTDLARLMHRADVGIQCFVDIEIIFDTSAPNKFFDYIAAGLPVVINYPGWTADLVRSEDVGRPVPPRDPAALAQAIAWLADHRDEARAMGRRARSLAERRFDRRRFADQAVDLFEGLVPGAPLAHPAL